MKNVKRHIYSSLSARSKLKKRTGKEYSHFFEEKDMPLKELMALIKQKKSKEESKVTSFI